MFKNLFHTINSLISDSYMNEKINYFRPYRPQKYSCSNILPYLLISITMLGISISNPGKYSLSFLTLIICTLLFGFMLRVYIIILDIARNRDASPKNLIIPLLIFLLALELLYVRKHNALLFY